MTKTKKKELKARLFKILHGICYVLSAIFVLVLIVAGVKGCGGKKAQRTPSQSIAPQQLVYNNGDLPYQYFDIDIAQNSNVNLDLEYQQNLVGSAYDLSLSGASSEYYIYLYESSNQGYVYAIETEEYLVQSIVIYLDSYEYSATDVSTYLRVREVYVRYDSYNHLIYSKVSDYASDDQYSTDEFALNYRVSSDYIITFSEPSLNYIFTPVATGSFTFNKAFNYNAPMGLSVDSPYGNGASWTTATQDMAHVDYNVGEFYSNGQIFDTIQYWCTNGGASDFEILTASGTSTISQGAEGSWSYIWLYYVNSKTNVSVIVNYRNQVAYLKNSTTNAYYYQNASTWQNDEYRYVTFLLPLNDAMQTKIMAFNNNNQYSGGSIYSGGGDIFTLIGSAFSGILPILSIMILPNITLGMLLFVPLVAILVFAIVKIVKK